MCLCVYVCAVAQLPDPHRRRVPDSTWDAEIQEIAGERWARRGESEELRYTKPERRRRSDRPVTAYSVGYSRLSFVSEIVAILRCRRPHIPPVHFQDEGAAVPSVVKRGGGGPHNFISHSRPEKEQTSKAMLIPPKSPSMWRILPSPSSPKRSPNRTLHPFVPFVVSYSIQTPR